MEGRDRTDISSAGGTPGTEAAPILDRLIEHLEQSE